MKEIYTMKIKRKIAKLLLDEDTQILHVEYNNELLNDEYTAQYSPTMNEEWIIKAILELLVKQFRHDQYTEIWIKEVSERDGINWVDGRNLY